MRGLPAFVEHWGTTYAFPRHFFPRHFSLGNQDCRGWRAGVQGFLATGVPTPARPVLAAPSPWHGGTIAVPGNSQAWLLHLCSSFPMQQVASSCLRCCTLRPSPPVGSLLLCPCPAITPSPLAQGCSPPTRGQGLAFTSGILLLWKRGPLGFLAASCSAVPPPLPP